MKQKDKLIIIQNIKEIREKSGLSKTKMAEICGICFNTLTKIEQGIYPPLLNVDVIINLALYFNISPSVLFYPNAKEYIRIKQ